MISEPIIVALLGVAGVLLTVGGALAGKWFFDRPRDAAREKTAQEQADIAAAAHMLDEAQYYQVTLAMTRTELAALTVRMAEESRTCHAEIDAIRAAGAKAVADAEKDNKALQTQVARLLLRVDTLEHQPGVGTGP